MSSLARGQRAGQRPPSLRRAYGRLLLLAALLPAVAFGVFTLVDQYLAEQRVLADRLGASAVVTANSIDESVHSKLSSVLLLARLHDGSNQGWMADLQTLLDTQPLLVTGLATDASGRALAVAPAARLPRGETLPDVADRDYFRVPRDTLRPYVSDAFRGRGLGQEALVAISAPLLRDGRFAGVVEGSIRTDVLLHEGGRAFVARGYEVAILDRQGQVIFATPGLGLAFLQRVDADARFGPPSGGGPALLRAGVFPDGERGFAARVPMRSGWTLVIASRQAPVLRAMLGRGGLLLALLGLVTAGVLLASWFQMRQLAEGTRTLLGVLSGIAPGERPSRERLAAMPQELAPVARAIDELSERLNQAHAGQRAALLREQAMSASLRDAVERREQIVAERTEALRAAAAELDRLSRTDPLTAALNLRGLEHVLGAADHGLADGPFGVVALDIDHFKAYNDRYGHPAGDTALKRVVGAVRGVLRGEHDQIARVGGEEFLVLLPGTDAAHAREVGERIRLAVRDAGIPHADAPGGVLTVSLGMAVAQAARDIRAALAEADRALYRAKHAGRDRLES